jgi:hypothetical protein
VYDKSAPHGICVVQLQFDELAESTIDAIRQLNALVILDVAAGILGDVSLGKNQNGCVGSFNDTNTITMLDAEWHTLTTRCPIDATWNGVVDVNDRRVHFDLKKANLWLRVL